MIIGLIGLMGSGKDTVGQHLVNNYGYEVDSFAATLKDVTAQLFDWDRDKCEGNTPESRHWREQPDPFWSEKMGREWTPRLALQLLGTDVIRNNLHNDMWVDTVENRILKRNNSTVITDVRFPNEAKKIQEMGGKLIRVSRGKLPEWYETASQVVAGLASSQVMENTYKGIHASEWAIAGVPVDYEIDNNGTLDDLYRQTDDVMQSILTSVNSTATNAKM